MVNAEVSSGGELSLDGQIIGRIQGFRYTPDATIRAEIATIDDAATASAIAQEFEVRANRLSEAVDSALVLANDGAIRWLGEPIAKIAAGDSLLAPRALILADETLAGEAQQKAQGRVDLWLAAYIRRQLGPLFDLESGAGLEGAARAVGQRLVENLGVLERGRVAQDVKTLDQNARGMLRRLGVRFGAYYIYIPTLVKPAIRVLATQLWALRQGGSADGASLHEIPQLAASGRTSFLADSAIPKETYRVAGFRLCGERAVRVDIVERLADLIRPAVAYRSGLSAGAPPPGSADGDGFVVTGAMTSLTGCSGEQFASVLRSLGFVSHLVKGPALTPMERAPEAPPVADAPTAADAPVAEDAPVAAEAAAAGDAEADQISEASLGEGEGAQGEPRAAPASVAEDAPIDAEAAADAEADQISQPSLSEGQGELIEPRAAAADEMAREDVACEPAEAFEPAAQAHEASPGLSAEPAHGAPESAAAPEAPTEAEQVQEPVAEVAELLIEVWRPRPPIRQRGPRGAGRERPSAQPIQGDAQAAHEARAPDETGRRRRRPASRPPPRPAIEAEAPPKAEPERFRGGRPSRRQPESANQAQGPHRPRGGQNPDRPHDARGRRERRPEDAPAPAARREAPVNLDSPFAKLLALKLQLEAKGKGD